MKSAWCFVKQMVSLAERKLNWNWHEQVAAGLDEQCVVVCTYIIFGIYIIFGLLHDSTSDAA